MIWVAYLLGFVSPFVLLVLRALLSVLLSKRYGVVCLVPGCPGRSVHGEFRVFQLLFLVWGHRVARRSDPAHVRYASAEGVAS